MNIPQRSRLHVAHRSVAATGILATLTVVVAGCGLTIPTDPGGTLDAVTGATMHVGVSPEPGLAEFGEPEPTGAVVDLAEEFAASLDTRIEWTVGSEETLVGALESGEIDLAIGGFTDQTPWSDRAGVSRGYPEIEGADGRGLIFLVPLGENAFLHRLETFLDQKVGS